MRGAMIGWMVFAALLLGLSIGRAADRSETTLTVQVTSAEHETDEGYFSLGKDTTLLVKPGTELHQFLAGGAMAETINLLDPDDAVLITVPEGFALVPSPGGYVLAPASP